MALGEFRATAFIRQGGQGTDHRFVALKGAEVAFHSPHRDQCLAINAVALFDTTQQVGILLQQSLAIAHAQRRKGAFEVFPHRAAELGLAAISLDDAHVGGDVFEGVIENQRVDPCFQGLRTEVGLPFAEALGGLDFKGVCNGSAGGHRGRGRRHRQGLSIGCGGFLCAGD